VQSVSGVKKQTQAWGQPLWQIDFEPEGHPLPRDVDIAIIGGGFTGLAAGAWLRRLAPEKIVAVFEANRLGSGASGRTGGIALGETAADDLPGLGDVLGGFAHILRELEVDCQFTLSGVWEIARREGRLDSPLVWKDSGTLRVANEVPGGTVEPGMLLNGLARAAQHVGVVLCEHAPVETIRFDDPLELELPRASVRARQMLFAANAQSLELSGLQAHARAKFTLAVATEPLKSEELEATGLGQRKPFYTLDLPYLWGRVLANTGVVFGGGLVDIEDSRQLAAINVSSGEAAKRLRSLEQRVRGLHPALRSVKFTHRWGGSILFGNAFRPFFGRHPRSRSALVLGAYSGQGVTLSVYLGCWAAEVLLGRKELPSWGAIAKSFHSR